MFFRIRRSVVASAMALGALPLIQGSARAQEKKVTVAVLNFTATAMVKRDEYSALADGIPIILGSELVTHPAIQLVERENLQKVMNELNLARTDMVDAQQAVKVGKLLNAQYLVLGGFLVDTKENMQLTSRVVEVETGLIKSATKVSGKGQDVFELVAKLTKALSPLLNIEPPKGRDRPSEPAAGGTNDVQALVQFVAADREAQNGNKTEAIRLAKTAMQLSPKVEPECRELLTKLGAT